MKCIQSWLWFIVSHDFCPECFWISWRLDYSWRWMVCPSVSGHMQNINNWTGHLYNYRPVVFADVLRSSPWQDDVESIRMSVLKAITHDVWAKTKLLLLNSASHKKEYRFLCECVFAWVCVCIWPLLCKTLVYCLSGF